MDTLIACDRGRLYCLPLSRLFPEAEKSWWSSTTGFSSLVGVKIKRGRGWKSFCFDTANTKRKLTLEAKQVSLAAVVCRGCLITSTTAMAQLHAHIILQRYNETSVKGSVVSNLEEKGSENCVDLITKGEGGRHAVCNYC